MATYISTTALNGSPYRTASREEEGFVEFRVTIPAGVTLTDGDFINLFELGEGHELTKFYYTGSAKLDSGGTETLEIDIGNDSVGTCVASGASSTDWEDAIPAIVYAQTAAAGVAFASTTATGASSRMFRLEVRTTAANAVAADADIYGYARFTRTPASTADVTYGWDGEEV